MAVAAALIIIFCIIEYYLISKAGPLPLGSNILIFTVININILLILTLCFLVIRNIVKLIFEDRRHILGARLRTRLVAAFIFLSLLPTILLFFVSLYFLNTSLAYWFDSRVDAALENAVAIGQSYYEEQSDLVKRYAVDMAGALAGRCFDSNGTFNIECAAEACANPYRFFMTGHLAGDEKLHYIEILTPEGRSLWSRVRLPLLQKPAIPDPVEIRDILDRMETVTIHSDMENGELVKTAVPVMNPDGKPVLLLMAGKALASNLSGLLDEVRRGYEEYNQFRLFQDPIKATLIITLFLITMLIIFVAIWFGIRMARGITEPVQMLADATHRVAQGDLDFTLEARGRDELSGLVRAFNTMTRDLKEARALAEKATRGLRESYREIEHSRAYMEILLHSITTGVISIDMEGKVTTINRSACVMLGIESDAVIGSHYSSILDRNQTVEFENIRRDLARAGKGVLQRHIVMERQGRKLSLLVNFAVLKDQTDLPLGVIIVFDDLTEIEKVQRMAAWREVARRLAHEVKNPLTPIKLSAQRLNKKYRSRFHGEEKEIFVRCTETIIGQSDELRRLVDEFSRFARTPAPVFRQVHPAELVDSVIALYMDNSSNVQIVFTPQDECPELLIDPDQIKRALINLIDNAISVMPGGGKIAISIEHDAGGGKVRISVSDTGPGVSEEDRNRLFEPYFSRKGGGSGLGLAIVSSIMADHNGSIYLGHGDEDEGGATFIMEFPV
jgi:two-component system nitrogen regulation sensor histidine kinase NtrY